MSKHKSKAAISDKQYAEEILKEIFSSYVGEVVDDGSFDDISILTQDLVKKNPLCVPLDALHLERMDRERIKGPTPTKKDGSIDYRRIYKLRTDIIPALDVRWLTEDDLHRYAQYQPYYPQFSKEENHLFIHNNLDFISTLEKLLKHDFHKFWCILLFSPEARTVLQEFLVDPVYTFDYDCLNQQEKDVYATIILRVLHVYQRMFRFKQSEAEYLSEEVGINFLITTRNLTTPVIMKLAMLYNSLDENFVKKVVQAYYAPKYKSVYVKGLRETLLTTKQLLEAVDNIVTETEKSSLLLVTTEIRGKPTQFDPHWAQEMIAHLVEGFFSLSSFLPLLDEAIEIAIELDLPQLIPMVYNSVFEKLDAYMTDRASVTDELRLNIYNYMIVARNEAVKSYDAMISYCIRKIVALANNDKDQESLVEMYLEWMQAALEYDVFIIDYNYYSSIALQIDQISTFYPKIEQLRVKYIEASLETILSKNVKKESLQAKKQRLKNCKLSDLWKCIWKVPFIDPVPQINVAALDEVAPNGSSNERRETRKEKANKPKKEDEEVEQKIRSIMDTLPHLGDGFILQCLQHYQYNITDTLAAILDENLPPHLAEIPFDTPRIPEETEPEEQPFIAHRGKREDYKDAMQLLNDKEGIKGIRDLIIIKSMTEEASDEEFDDRFLDDGPVPPDDNEERVLRHLKGGMKNIAVVSDPSDESDDEDGGEASARKPGAFCEDPALIRARREAQRRGGGRGRGFDVVGKPKGQGQEKDVLHNRDKKNVQKSSRANHNRKRGAQWKRSRGMMS